MTSTCKHMAWNKSAPDRMYVAAPISFYPPLTWNQTQNFVSAVGTCRRSGIIEREDRMPHFIRFMKAETKGRAVPVVVGRVSKSPFYYQFNFEAGGLATEYVYTKIQRML